MRVVEYDADNDDDETPVDVGAATRTKPECRRRADDDEVPNPYTEERTDASTAKL